MAGSGHGMVLLLVGLMLAGCKETRRGTLEVHWQLNGAGADAGLCAATGADRVRVLFDATGEEPDDNPANPTWQFVDFPCVDLIGQTTIEEGIYRVRVVALSASDVVLSPVVEAVGVEVVHGSSARVPPTGEPPFDLEIATCGDGAQQLGEQCDGADLGSADCASLGAGVGVLACDVDCRFDTSACQLEMSDIDVSWEVWQADGQTLSDCANEGIVDVDVVLTVAGVGSEVVRETVPCTDLAHTLAAVDFGLYTVRLIGVDGGAAPVAGGSSPVLDHTDFAGASVSIALVVNP